MRKKRVTNKTIQEFRNCIWKYYREHGREFEWRSTTDPYHIVVSEVMLQQTQTSRVVTKFPLFIRRFPTFELLAQATLHEVLFYWQGLGYNRRGKYLHLIAKSIVTEYNSKFPNDPAVLVNFPGIGTATAASIVAFAFNKPTCFIETNIRSVFLYYFFDGKTAIPDSCIMPLIELSVDKDNPREWYYALMDFGVLLKKKIPNPSRSSAHHTRQSKFEGSDRQVRGLIIKLLTQNNAISQDKIYRLIDREPSVITSIISDLCKEGLITLNKGLLHISDL